MPNLKVSDAELQGILNELENDLSKYLKDTQGKLSKAREEDGTPSPGMGGASPSAAAAPSAEEGAPAEAPAGAGDTEVPPEAGAAEGAPPMEGAPGEGAPAEGGDPAAEQGIDPQALEAEYAQLPVEELKAHYLAAKSALFQVMGQQQGGAQGAPPPGAPAGPPPGPPAGPPPGPPGAGSPPPAFKAEMPSDGNGKIEKSEVADLRAQLGAMAKIVNLLAGQPVQKAVTGMTYVGKSEPEDAPVVRDPAMITAKLSKLTRDPSLKKSDRERITGYYEGIVNVDAIADLLK